MTNQCGSDVKRPLLDTTTIKSRQQLQYRQGPGYLPPHCLQICSATRLASS